jgi:hypothetical protein
VIDTSNLPVLFEDFFKDNMINIYVDKIQTDENKLRLKDKNSQLYINIIWEDVIYELFDNNKENFLTFINENLNVAELLLYIASNDIYVNCNKFLNSWQSYQKHEDRKIIGFFETKKKYAEFEIEENHEFINEYYDDLCYFDLITHFSIGDIEIRISSPSDIYRILFFHQISDKILRLPSDYISWNENSWKNRITMSFKNISGNNKEALINDVLQEALFIMKLYNKQIYNLGITTYSGQKSIQNLEEYPFKKFPKSDYVEPLCFYNEAHKHSNEMKFLNFYKVLEFFFDKNKKEQAIIAIDEYKKLDSSTEKKEENLHLSLKNIYINSEEAQLKNLLKNEKLVTQIRDIINSNFDESMTPKKFVKKLYKVRNNIVHSQDSSSKIPEILINEDVFAENNYGLGLSNWIDITEELCLICIQHFCYNDETDMVVKFHNDCWKY